MSLPWSHRKERLAALLKVTTNDEDEGSLALDRLLHGYRVIGKTTKSNEIDNLRFQDRDLQELGTLESGQFGVVHVVNCRLNKRVYVRKSIEKRFVIRNREHVHPLHERLLLLLATKQDSPWAPHLLAAFQTPTHLNLVMNYIEGGSLGDVLESSPLGRIEERDLRWWTPQVITAINWCHDQGFAHRDIKPQNILISPTSQVVLIDFGSTAPLLPPADDGSRMVSHPYCAVPVGTCDYISPEILRKSEEAFVRMELEDESDESGYRDPYSDEDSILSSSAKGEGYGRETDWWSFGVMLYELAYGTTPFFAPDIRQTYAKIVNHKNYLKFSSPPNISGTLQEFISRLLCDHQERIGRYSVHEIMNHVFFDGIDWNNLIDGQPHADLHLPKFLYSDPTAAAVSAVQQYQGYIASPGDGSHEIQSRAFAFSALFQSSAEIDPESSNQHPTTSAASTSHLHGFASSLSPGIPPLNPEDAAASFIGFSWGPPKDAFLKIETIAHPSLASLKPHQTPIPPRPDELIALTHMTPNPFLGVPSRTNGTAPRPPRKSQYPYETPLRPASGPAAVNPAITPFRTLPRSTIHSGTSGLGMTAQRKRAYSEREALQQMINCVGMSARKKVLESGRKPRLLTCSFDYGERVGELKLEVNSPRDDLDQQELQDTRAKGRSLPPVNIQSWANSSQARRKKGGGLIAVGGASSSIGTPGFSIVSSSFTGPLQRRRSSNSSQPIIVSESETEASLPPSPSPTPRPGSAMSRGSGWGRSGTPMLFNATATFTQTQIPTPSVTRRIVSSESLTVTSPYVASNQSSRRATIGNATTDSSTLGPEDPTYIDRTSSHSHWPMPASRNSGDLDLDRRHAKLISNIMDIERRLFKLAQTFKSET